MPSNPRHQRTLQQPLHHASRSTQSSIQSPHITPTSLRKIRPPTTLTPNLSRQQPNNLPRLQSRSKILRHPNNQRNLPINSSPEHHHTRPEPPTQFIHKRTHLRLIQPIHPLRQHLHALHLDRSRTSIRQRGRRRLHPHRIQLPPQLLHLLFLRRNPMPQRIRRRHALRRRTHKRPHNLSHIEIPSKLVQCPGPRNRLHTSHPRRHRPLPNNLHQPNLTRSPRMN